MDYKTRLHLLNESIRAAAPPTFPRFQDFPCEIRLMIWREFFLEPRFFQAVCQLLEEPVKHDLRWTLVHYGSSRTYYTAIDTQINKESTDVARKIRPKSCFPTFSPDDGVFIIVSVRDSPAYFHVNWDVDFVNLDSADLGCHLTYAMSESISWYSKVRNLSLGPGRGGSPEPLRYLSLENSWLWMRCYLLPNLKSIIHWQNPFWKPGQNSAAYFQTRYLLRESPKIPPEWKDVVHEACLVIPGTVPDTTQPRWSDFLEQLRAEGWQLDMDYLQDEVEGAKQLL